MESTDIQFAGSIPEFYDRCLGPFLFEPYAADLAARARSLGPRSILETAAGTGIVTAALARALPDARIVATDLNPDMLRVAQSKIDSPRVTFAPADALALPFPDGGFDLVVCQFGAMFFPDKVRGHSEARRVLRDSGRYLLAIWDRIERNVLTDVAQKVLIDCFPNDPPLFMREGPFGYADTSRIEQDLHDAGFESVEIETVELPSRSASAHEAATALCYGTPMGVEVDDRDPGSLERIFDAVEKALQPFEGPDGVDAPMAAHIVTATK